MADIRERLVIEAFLEGNAIKQINTLEREVVDFSRRASSGLRSTEADFNRFARTGERALGRVTAGTRASTAAIRGLRRVVGLLTPGLNGLVAGFLGITAITGSARAANEFGVKLAEVGTIAGLTSDELSLLGRATDEIAIDFGISDLDAVAAQYQAISGGIRAGAESTEFLADAAKLSTVGVASLTSSVDTLTSILNAYGLEAKDAGAVSDILFKSVELGKTTIAELGSAVGDVIPPAAALELELAQVFAAISTLTKTGSSTAEVSTQLKAVFTQLANESSATSIKLKGLGVQVGLVRSDLLKFLDAVAELEDDQIAEVFGSNVRAFLPILNLTGKLREEFIRQVDEIRRAGGSVDAALDAFLEAPAVRARRNLNTFKIAFRSLGEAVVEGFNEAVDDAGGADVIAKQIRATGTVLAEVVTVVGRALGSSLGSIAAFVDELGGAEAVAKVTADALNLIASGGRLVVTLLGEAARAAASFFSSIASQGAVLEGVFGVLDAVPGSDFVAKALGVDPASAGRIGKAFLDFSNAFDELGSSMATLGRRATETGEDVEETTARAEQLANAAKNAGDEGENAGRRMADAFLDLPGLVVEAFRSDLGREAFLKLTQQIDTFGLNARESVELSTRQWIAYIGTLDETIDTQEYLIDLAREVGRAQLAAAANAEAGGTRVAASQRVVRDETLDLTRSLLDQGVAYEQAIDAARKYAFEAQNGLTPALKAAREAGLDWADSNNAVALTAAATGEALDLLADGAGRTFAEFVTGSATAEEALRSFVTTALTELSRLAASAAFRNLAGGILNAFGPAATAGFAPIGTSAGGAAAQSATTGVPTFSVGPGASFGYAEGGGIARQSSIVGLSQSEGVAAAASVQRSGGDLLGTSVPRGTKGPRSTVAEGFADGGGLQAISRFAPISRGTSNALLGSGLPGYANGAGPFNSPHLAVIGEGRSSEFVVPTPDGRSIPIKRVDGGDSGTAGGAMQITINLRVEALDPRRAAEVITQPETMRQIENSFARSLALGSNRNLSQSVRQA